MAEIHYRVTGRISVQSVSPVFEQTGMNRYASTFSISEDDDQLLDRLVVLLSPDQVHLGYDWNVYPLKDGDFEIEILVPRWFLSVCVFAFSGKG